MAQASKVHAYSFDPEQAMPVAIAKAYHTWGLRGTKCGYMRKVTLNNDEVTCKHCLRIIANIGDRK